MSLVPHAHAYARQAVLEDVTSVGKAEILVHEIACWILLLARVLAHPQALTVSWSLRIE